MSILPCATFISPGNPFYGGGSIPIVSGSTTYSFAELPAGADSIVLLLDTSDPAKFPPNTDYFYTLTSTVPGASQSSCDTTKGQLSAMGIFSIGNNNQYTTFASGSGVNTLTTTLNNPRDFYLSNNNPISQPSGIYLYTTSASDFIGCFLFFSWTPATRV
jgi:hypothetical protein